MNDVLQSLTQSEQNLLERFAQYDEKKLTHAAQDILDDYKNQVFICDIFAIIVEDVLQVLSLNEWNEVAYRKIIFTANSIYNTSGCFFPANQHLLFAIPIVWITYYCKYKDGSRILTSDIKPHSIINDSIQLEHSLSAQFFNYFAGPPVGKAKKLEKYMFEKYDPHYRESDTNNNHTINFQTLLYFLSVTNFIYEPVRKNEY